MSPSKPSKLVLTNLRYTDVFDSPLTSPTAAPSYAAVTAGLAPAIRGPPSQQTGEDTFFVDTTSEPQSSQTLRGKPDPIQTNSN